MGKIRQWGIRHLRGCVQFAVTALSNGYVAGFLHGNIYRGNTKAICLPGLNCYSCPGALGACPIGAFQAVIGNRNYHFAFYVAGFLIFVGALMGRLVCGWLCPFGWIQELLYKIPFVKKLRKLPGDKWLRYLKYVILLVFVVLLPMTVLDLVGQGSPWFCKYICPSGTLMAGFPLAVLNPAIRAGMGGLFLWKAGILVVVALLSILVYRPFCRYLCPLGAVYGLFNPISLYRFRIDEARCTKCGICQKACKLDIPVYQKPNSMECIRCGDCKKACPHGAIYTINKKGETISVPQKPCN